MNKTLQSPVLLSRDFAQRLADATPPCVSLYQPTHRSHPENTQDPIRFRNLLKSIEASLHEAGASTDAAALLEPFRALAADDAFWAHTLDGLAVFCDADRFEVFKAQRPLPERVVVGDSFHTKPLRRLMQSADRFQVLALARKSVRVLEGDRYALDAIELSPEVPQSMAEALGEQLTEPHQTVASYGGAGPGSTPMHHGSGARSDEMDSDDERFFRAVDRAVQAQHSSPSGLPLILAALPEHHALFRKVSSNPLLVDDGIMINPEALTNEELRDLAWALNEPAYRARLAALGDNFAKARAGGMGSEDRAEVAAAAQQGRVDTLLVEADRQLPGRLDRDTGRIEQIDPAHPQAGDLLDDLAELVEANGGQVLVVAAAEMPVKTGVAASYRY